MRGQATFQEFLPAVVVQLKAMPRRGFVEAGVLGALFAGYGLLSWSRPAEPDWLGYAIMAASTSALVLTTYSITMLLAGARRSLSGFLKFALTSLAMLAPVAVTLGLLLVSLKFYKHALALVPILAFMLASVGVLIFLPAWPLAQALASRAVGPMRMLRATKGHRGALFTVSFVTGAFNRVVPDIDKARSFLEAGLIALADTAVTFATLVLGASIAVTAWKLAVEKDSDLGASLED